MEQHKKSCFTLYICSAINNPFYSFHNSSRVFLAFPCLQNNFASRVFEFFFAAIIYGNVIRRTKGIIYFKMLLETLDVQRMGKMYIFLELSGSWVGNLRQNIRKICEVLGKFNARKGDKKGNIRET